MNRITARPLIFGEVLFDCFPDGKNVLGGAPFNVAWNLQAFGLEPVFVSRVGNDSLGHDIRGAMKTWGMDTSQLQVDSSRPTGTVQIQFFNGEPHYEILPERAYDFISAQMCETIPEPALIYHGSLALRNAPSRTALAGLKARFSSPVFVDVNLRAPWWEKTDVIRMLQHVRWCKLNEDELAILCSEKSGIEDRSALLQEKCDIDLLVVTRGSAGALARQKSGEIHEVRPAPGLSIVDTVGAGDAFSSVLVLGLMGGWSLPLILERAQAFASACIGMRGATVRDRLFYQPFVDAWDLS
ncbi:MAG: carbohydrate kinase [Pseudomonadota bacterium]